MEELNLPDRYVVLLENVITENKRLREAIEARDTTQQRLLTQLTSKVEASHAQAEDARVLRSRSTNGRKRITVPKLCRQDFRRMYMVLKKGETFKGFNLEESFFSKVNEENCISIITEIEADNGGQERCPWSRAQLKGAAATYFKSLNDAKVRRKNGTANRHRVLCRRQGRVRDKAQRRVGALAKIDWSEGKTNQVKEVLTVEYTSSDESSWSDDENGNSVVTGYFTKKLPWERLTLTNVKKELDTTYHTSITARARGCLLGRYVHPESSTRERPVDNVGWAVRPQNTVGTADTNNSPRLLTATPNSRVLSPSNNQNRSPASRVNDSRSPASSVNDSRSPASTNPSTPNSSAASSIKRTATSIKNCTRKSGSSSSTKHSTPRSNRLSPHF